VSGGVSARYPELDTPSLLIHLDAMERNIAEMAQVARVAGVKLRPHTKTHKSPEIAAMQIAAGAQGITVAKIGEAEVMADAGVDDILIAYPIVGESKLGRLGAVMERAHVRLSLDSVEVAEGLGRLGAERGEPVEVLVEVDTGQHRMGRPPGEQTARLVLQIARVPGIRVVGLLTHEGHAYAARRPKDMDRLITRLGLDLLLTREMCQGPEVSIDEVSVGSTPTARAVAQIPEVTEIRPGTYVFNDVQQMRLGVATEETCAARVLATVVARPWENRFVIDAGSKCFTSDGGDGPPLPGRGVVAGRPDLRLDFLTEEHGIGHIEPGGAPLAIGERLEIVPLHVCSTVNMFDVAYGLRGDEVDRELRIEGRGKVQ
jgi:D-serine deaminase-like pyridoxal phosphate-dependent protein